jgi:hypothetical protein
MTKRSIWQALVLLLSVALVATACGPGESVDVGDDTTTTAPAVTDTTAPTDDDPIDDDDVR